MERIKENAISEFIKMIKQSWTWERMTDEEQDRFIDCLGSIQTQKAVIGTFDQRWHILQALYNSYLIGIGYTNWNWREPKEEDIHTIRNRHLQNITQPHPFIGHPHY